MKKKDYYDNILNTLNNGEIENIPLKNINILKKVFSDKEINKLLYKGFKKNYEIEYGNDSEYLLMKVQDMIYRIFLLVNYSMIDRYGITDQNVITDVLIRLIENKNVSLFDAVSYDDYDLEIIQDSNSEIRELLEVRKI